MRREILYTKIISEFNRLTASSVIQSVWILYSSFSRSNIAYQMS
jgi:hypothetical protein